VDQRFKQCGEKPHCGKAHHADGHIRGFDAGIEQYPVQSKESAASGSLHDLAPSHTRTTSEHNQYHRGEQHAIPHDVNLVERDELAEKAGEARQEHAQMQLYEAAPPLARIVRCFHETLFLAAKLQKTCKKANDNNNKNRFD
jgi:hypothetical protein